MVAKEFLVELESIRASFEWKLFPDPSNIPERRSRPRLRIRGISKNAEEQRVFDPIGAVCYIKTGRIFTDDAWLDAATEIELSLIDASDVIAAANDRGWVDMVDGRKPSEYIQRLRTRLGACVDLKLTP
jgi:hypothetical protein